MKKSTKIALKMSGKNPQISNRKKKESRRRERERREEKEGRRDRRKSVFIGLLSKTNMCGCCYLPKVFKTNECISR